MSTTPYLLDPAAHRPMVTLGINAAFHDSAAAIVVDGELVAAAEEERFSRIKHAKRPLPFTAWELPYAAIDYCLAAAGVELREVDHVAYSFRPDVFARDRLGAQTTIALPLQPPAEPAAPWESPWDPLFLSYILNAPRQLVDGVPLRLRKRFEGIKADAAPYRWHYVDHHQCHQASAFLASPFDRCAVMTLDGRGEHATTTYGAWRNGRYESLGVVEMPHSLGMLYERITQHLGFLHSSDEYKVMALAALGTPQFRRLLAEHIEIGAHGQYRVLPLDLTTMCGAPRTPGAPMEQHHLDLAASLQDVLEDTVLQLARWLRERSGESVLAMAGGVALNCVMNARLRDAGIFDAVWVQPAAGDAGTALGAALWTDAQERGSALTLGARRFEMRHAYWGPGFDDAAIEQHLRWAKLRYRRSDDLSADVARLLADNRIVGWFQGRMEFGPRALGARSILASPIAPTMQARLNELKDREGFRPVAPALPQEELAHWFAPPDANGGMSPFMLFVYDVIPIQAARIPAACHTDRTARVQTVDHDSNPRFHALLREFGRITGVPVLVNTSFNVRGEPIVCTPRDAIEAFCGTPLDALAIGSFILEKPEDHAATTR
ncbi:MAG TPA: carbamoyltransferase C-terminal domain-containing protein [Burkholderiaceae bacterium]